MRSAEILNEVRIRTKDSSPDYLIGFRGNVWVIDSKKSFSEQLANEIIKELNIDIKFDDPDEVREYVLYDIRDYRPDIIIGYIYDGYLNITSNDSGHHPITSSMMKKIVQAVGLKGIAINGLTYDGNEEEEITPDYKMKGNLPERLFHGTSTKFIQSISKTGLRPNINHNWAKSGIKHSSLIFGAVSLNVAAFHANRTTFGENYSNVDYIDPDGPFPVIIEFEIPDPNRIVPDYDVASTSMDLDDEDVFDKMTGLGYTNMAEFGGKYQANSDIPKNNPEGRYWKSTGLFGYHGRIPASKIVGVYCNFVEGPITGKPIWSGTSLKEFFEEWERYFNWDDEDEYLNEDASIIKKKDAFGITKMSLGQSPKKMTEVMTTTLETGVLLDMMQTAHNLLVSLTEEKYDLAQSLINKLENELTYRYSFMRKHEKETDKRVFGVQHTFVSELHFKRVLRKNGNRFADAHEKVPVWNDIQNYARKLAVSLGRMYWKSAEKYVDLLVKEFSEISAGEFNPTYKINEGHEEEFFDDGYQVSDVLGFLHTWHDKNKIDDDRLNQLKQSIRAISKNGRVSMDDLVGRWKKKDLDINKFKQGLDNYVRKQKLNESENNDAKIKAFKLTGDTQRGAPELAMVAAQGVLGGGVMSYAIEHIGDLTHRITAHVDSHARNWAYDATLEKVDKMLRMLRHKYGFKKEFEENMQTNLKYSTRFVDMESYEEAVKEALAEYVKEHRKVPVWNDLQYHCREAAIAIGQVHVEDAIKHLEVIEKADKDGTFAEKAEMFDPDYNK